MRGDASLGAYKEIRPPPNTTYLSTLAAAAPMRPTLSMPGLATHVLLLVSKMSTVLKQEASAVLKVHQFRGNRHTHNAVPSTCEHNLCATRSSCDPAARLTELEAAVPLVCDEFPYINRFGADGKQRTVASMNKECNTIMYIV